MEYPIGPLGIPLTDEEDLIVYYKQLEEEQYYKELEELYYKELEENYYKELEEQYYDSRRNI